MTTFQKVRAVIAMLLMLGAIGVGAVCMFNAIGNAIPHIVQGILNNR